MSALTWAVKWQCCTGVATNAAIVYTQLAIAGQPDGVGVHLPTVDNKKTDQLSRRESWGAAGLSSGGDGQLGRGFPGSAGDRHIMELLSLRQPTPGECMFD